MAIIVKDEFEIINPTAGMVQAVLQGVYDIGTQRGVFQNKETFHHKVLFVWEIDETIPKGKFQGERFMVRKNYNLSFGSLATLRIDLESWFSKKMSDEKAKEGIDLESLIGRRATLNLIESDDGKYINCKTVMPPMPNNQMVVLYKGAPQFVQKAIEKSVEWQKKNNEQPESAGWDESQAQQGDDSGLPF